MGSRIGYRIRDGNDVSNLVRKQWKEQSTEEIITQVAETLMHDSITDGLTEIGSGLCAMRDDLGIDRMSAALYYVVLSRENNFFDIYTALINRFGAQKIDIAEAEVRRRGMLI